MLSRKRNGQSLTVWPRTLIACHFICFRSKSYIWTRKQQGKWRLNNTNSGLDNLPREMEGTKPRKDKHVPLFEGLPRRKIQIYYDNTTWITNRIETMHRSPINLKYYFYFQSNLDQQQEITRACSQRRKRKKRNFTTVRDKHMTTYTTIGAGTEAYAICPRQVREI